MKVEPPPGWVEHPTISYEDVMMSDIAAEEYNRWLKNRVADSDAEHRPSKDE